MFIQSGEWVIISSIKKFIKKYFGSLQFRIFFFFILVGIVPLYMVKTGILSGYEELAIQQRSNMIQNQCAIIADQLSDYSYIDGIKSDIIDTELSQLANLYSGRILIVNSEFRIIKDTYGLDENKTIISESVMQSYQGNSGTNYVAKSHYFEISVPIRDSITRRMIGTMLIAVPTRDVMNNQKELSNQVFILQVLLSILVIMIGFYLSKILVRPFSKVTKSLEEMRTGFLDEDISIPDYTETTMLSEAYNSMLHRMKDLDDSRQEFVSNVSHELKTPITSMKVLADSLLLQDDVPAELYREFLGDIAEEIDRENKIITDLLSLVKMDKKSGDLNIKETNINDMVGLIVKRLQPIAATKKVTLVEESFRPILAEVDETKLTLAISNLVENGIKYNKTDGWVHISLNADNKYVYIKVEDSGMGIPQEDQENVFERFYRVDKSHSREIGGTGLGLAITKSAVMMHRGAIKIYSKEGEGTTFTVRIPLKYIS